MPQVLTGGVDKTAIVFDRETQAQVATLSGHTKRVTDACFHPTKELLLTSSMDKTARVWQAVEGGDGGYKVAHVLDDHDGGVVGATVHATGDFVATASKDKSWAFYDINRLVCAVLAWRTRCIGLLGAQCVGCFVCCGCCVFFLRLWAGCLCVLFARPVLWCVLA